jgi:hypothetical protein
MASVAFIAQLAKEYWGMKTGAEYETRRSDDDDQRPEVL